jgi:hypothetical protein
MFKLSTSIIVQTFAKTLILRSIPSVATALIVALLLFPPQAHAFHLDPDLNPAPPFVICQHQRYALCAAADCFVYNGVAYCECDVSHGNSISLQLDYSTPNGVDQNVCDANQQGRANGYMVSTFSLPKQVNKGGTEALYTCPGSADAGNGVSAPVAYGQCDGGICYNSTRGQKFPGFSGRLRRNEIICSCPISTTATPGSSDTFGYQVVGAYNPKAAVGSRCDASACASCSVTNPTANGSTIPVGSPTGGGKFLTLQLYGSLPEINECLCSCTQGGDGSVSCAVGEDRTQ